MLCTMQTPLPTESARIPYWHLALLKIWAPASIPSVCSTDGRMYFSLRTDSFTWERSIRNSTRLLRDHNHPSTTSRRFLHSTNYSHVSIRRSSSLTFPIRGSGIRLGVLSENGVAPGFRLITYGCRTSPKPLHNFG